MEQTTQNNDIPGGKDYAWKFHKGTDAEKLEAVFNVMNVKEYPGVFIYVFTDGTSTTESRLNIAKRELEVIANYC